MPGEENHPSPYLLNASTKDQTFYELKLIEDRRARRLDIYGRTTPGVRLGSKQKTGDITATSPVFSISIFTACESPLTDEKYEQEGLTPTYESN